MQYYQKHLGDYYKKAGRLTMLQHGAYTLLIDACYDRERFPTREEAIEWTWASSEDEVNAVDFLLTRFFRKDGDIYIQDRVLQELESMKIKGLVNQLIAVSREQKRKNNTAYADACDELRNTIKHDPSAKSHETWVKTAQDVHDTYTERTQGVHDASPTHKPNNPIPNNPIDNNGDKSPPDYTPEFEQFWKKYPSANKGNKQNAFKAWKKLSSENKSLAEKDAIKFFQLQKKSNKDYFLHCTTYLNNKRWEDIEDMGNVVSIDEDYDYMAGGI